MIVPRTVAHSVNRPQLLYQYLIGRGEEEFSEPEASLVYIAGTSQGYRKTLSKKKAMLEKVSTGLPFSLKMRLHSCFA